MSKTRRDLIGQKFNRLLVIVSAGEDKWGKSKWWVLCDCGEYLTALGNALLSGNTGSCGCFQRDEVSKRSTIHGQSGDGNNEESSTHRSWRAMKRRCQNQQDTHYDIYGGRGIAVCERWHSFENFLADMGEKPPGLIIERINNDGNYEPDNCKWATYKEQAQNKRPRGRDKVCR